MRSLMMRLLWRIAQRMRRRSFLVPRPGIFIWTRLRPSRQSTRLEQKVDRLSDDIRFVRQRLTTYIGNGTALTFLADKSPFLVNSDDFGGPINFIAGGRYEQANLDVLLSYLRPEAWSWILGPIWDFLPSSSRSGSRRAEGYMPLSRILLFRACFGATSISMG